MPLLALAATQAVQSGEQISLSQAVKGIKAEFHTTDLVLGLLPLAMAVTGVLASFPFGALTDRSRRTRLVAAAMVLWSACMGVAALSVSLVMLFALRMGLGGIEASRMAGISLVADYYPVEERAKRISLYSAGALGGSIFAFGAGGLIVGAFGWRAAFLMWVPLGLVVAVAVARLPEPRRGDQDADFGTTLLAVPVAGGPAALVLPRPRRVGTCDYATFSTRDAVREVLRIRTCWYATAAGTAASLLLNAAQFWGIPYFERVHHLSTAAASGIAGALGFGSALGIVTGGFISDRLLRRGVVNARPYVAIGGSLLAVLVLTPAWGIRNLTLTAPLFVIGGACLTAPIPAIDAVLADVVVAELRGRAMMIQSVARVLSYVGPFLVGALATAVGSTHGDGLRFGLTVFTPVYLVAAFAMVLATRSYPHDLAYVCAESTRVRALRSAAPPIP
jgi:MFS family permease